MLAGPLSVDPSGQQASAGEVVDAISQRIAVANALGNRTSFMFDDAGRNTRITDPLGRRTSFAFDTASRQTRRIDGRGQPTTYLYDADDRQTSRRYADGTRVTQVFDNIGQRTVLNDSTGRTSWTFDAAGRTLMTINPAAKRISYAWDALSQRRYMIDPDGGRFSYVYDAAGRISVLQNPEGDRTSWTYDAAGRTLVQKLANATRASYSYDDADRVLRLANIGPGSTTLSSFAYKYDAVGNKMRVAEANGDRVTWVFDNTYQLTAERRSGANAYAATYAYDANGNRTLKVDSGARTTSAYDVADQIRRYQDSTGITSFTFDGAGNQTLMRTPAGQRTSYSWDGENRQTVAKVSPASIQTCTYTGEGLRNQKVDASGITNFLWDTERILEETDGTNITQVVYTVSPDPFGKLISQRRGTTTAYYHFNDEGSTSALTNSTGIITDSYLFRAYGEQVTSMGSSVNSFRFGGSFGFYWDSATLSLFVWTRNYVPTTASFLTPGSYQSDMLLENVYVYAASNPINRFNISRLQAQLVPKPVGAVKIGDCGEASAGIDWTWKDGQAPAEDGYIIQHVHVYGDVRRCDDPTVKIKGCDFQYWEAWQVSKGLIQGKSPLDRFSIPNMGSGVFVDFLGNSCLCCSYGTIHMEGHARYVPLSSIHPKGERPLPSTRPLRWAKGPKLDEGCLGCDLIARTWTSGALKHTSHDPNKERPKVTGIWNPDWDTSEESASHFLNSKWNCCPEFGSNFCPQNKSIADTNKPGVK